MVGADCHSQRINAGPLDKFDRIIRIGQLGCIWIDDKAVLSAANSSKLCLDRRAGGMRILDNAPCPEDVVFEWECGAVEHG